MTQPPQDFLAARWQVLARRTARKVSLGWWLAGMGPLVAAAGMAGCVGILWSRQSGTDVSWHRLWPWALAAAGLAGLVSWWRMRGRFIDATQAAVRLEAHLKLNNALTSAAQGLAPWPSVPERPEDGWRWNWRLLLAPWLVCAACLVLALVVPVAAQRNSRPLPTAQPQSWSQMQEWLEKLDEEKLISPEEKDEMTAKIEQLQQESPEKWFSHDSLHASDMLKEQMQRDMTRMAQNMSTLAQALNALKNHSETLSKTTQDKIIKDLQETLQDMKKSGMELHPDMLKELSQLDPDQLPSLSKEQSDALRETLKKNQQALKEMAGQNPGFLGDGEGEDDELAEMLGQMGKGQGQGNGGDEQDGVGPGQGDVSRGPGTAPLSLAQEENDFGTDKKTGVSTQDMSRANLGDMLGLQNDKHEVDKNYQGPGRSGGTQNQGQGGEQVWRETLTPEEKAVLKKVFQ